MEGGRLGQLPWDRCRGARDSRGGCGGSAAAQASGSGSGSRSQRSPSPPQGEWRGQWGFWGSGFGQKVAH